VKPLLAPVFCGTLAAALLYGLLWAAERRIPESEDPWIDGWLGDGLKAEFRSVSTEPKLHFMLGDARELFGPETEGTILRSYLIQNTSVQVVQLPKAGLVPSLPEGRNLDFRCKPKGNPVHLCRKGRWILLVATMEKALGPLIPTFKTTKDRAQQIFDSFEPSAAARP
jgi:hypothetical protein